MQKGQGKFLVIRGGAIGDFVLTLPVLQALRSHFPDTDLQLLAYPRMASLAVEAGWVSEAKSIESPTLARFFAPTGLPLPLEWLHYFERFDIILSYLFDPDALFQNNVKQAGNIHFIQGPHRPDESKDLHAIDAFLEPLERLAVFESGLLPDLTALVTKRAIEVSERPCIAIHPGSGSPQKNWPLPLWGSLIRSLIEGGAYQVLLIGGEAERETMDGLMAAFGKNDPIRCMMHQPLTDVARTLSACRLFVGHDSGITHLAASLGLPCVALWGPTRLPVWQPRGRRVTILESPDGLKGITPAQVEREMQRMLRTD